MPTPPATTPDWRSGAKQLLLRLRGRPDSEHEMSFNRLAFALLALACVQLINPEPGAVPLLVVYVLVSVGVLVHIVFDKRVSGPRRLFMIVVDNVALSAVLHGNGAYGAGFFPIYLWVIFGNGFRFGLPYLFASASASIVAFGWVVLATPFWRDLPGLSIGLLIGLVMLPAYAGQLIRKLSKAKAAAEEASRAKSYFLASVSHELRTPLTAIIGLSAHLQDSELTSDQKSMAGTIATAGRSLLSLINQLLDFSRLGANGITSEARSFNLLELLSSVRDLMRVGAEEKGLRLAVHVKQGTPLHLIGDETHLRDVLVNLVGNAVKFTDQGSVTISADLAAEDGRPKLLLAVADTGIGIDPEAQEHIFESFRQADGTIIDRFGGTGLGLAICKQVAELLGGEIGVESVPGEGSRFWFTAEVDVAEATGELAGGRVILLSNDDELIESFPTLLRSQLALTAVRSIDDVRRLWQESVSDCSTALFIDRNELERVGIPAASLCDRLGEEIAPVLVDTHGGIMDSALEACFVSALVMPFQAEEVDRAFMIATAARRVHGAQSARAEGQQATRAPLRVLVADDNLMNQKVFAKILERAGHSVQMAPDGEAALDVLKEHSVDLVLMDVNMPVLNGIEAAKLYRFSALGRKPIPIVAITADASPETAERCLDAGMNACISKPVEAEQLLRLLDELTTVASPVLPISDSRGVVTPLFPVAEAEPPAMNWDKLKDLEELGGSEFVTDLLHQFVRDVQDLLTALKESVDAGHVESFRSGTHALRSSGANIGADGVAEMCRHFQRIDAAEFEAKGRQHLAALEAELHRVRLALAERNASFDSSMASEAGASA